MSRPPYRNYNSYYRSQSQVDQESRVGFRQDNMNPRQNNSYLQDEEVEADNPANRQHYRVFQHGRETESENEQRQSIYDQRAHANQRQRQPRRYFQGNNYNRNNRGRRKNSYPNTRNSFQDCASDTESVSSSGSQPRNKENSLEFDCYNPRLNRYESDAERIPDGDQRNNVNLYNKRAVPDKIGTGWDKNDAQKNAKNPNLEALRNYKQSYETMMKSLDPTELIMDCREKVDEIAKDGIVKNLNNIEQIKAQLDSKNKCDVFKLHLENFVLQQKQFEDYIADVKGQLSSVYAMNNYHLLERTDEIKNSVQEECKLFKRSLPGYACKNGILNKVRDNKVTIVSADSNYFLSMLLPIFAKGEYKSHSFICCEPSEMLCSRLKRNVFYLMYDKVELDETDEKKLANSIQFMIEEELLNLLSNDYTFDEKNIFIVLNLALKRSVEMDIILANLRDMIKQETDSRLVLLCSVYDHASKYENYFAEEVSVGMISFPSLNLPVKSVWRSSALLPTDDYIAEEVKTILAIHTLNGSGDVMAFFPTLTDAKSASATLNQKMLSLKFHDTECVLLHEKSTNKYCLDLSSKQHSNKRTIFLVTDCAEMLVIPSVCFVVDCGLRKEHMFDSSKKLDVLTTTFISRDKCKLRKSLAGTFTKGIYYRLYNKEDYKREMPTSEYPEFLTVNPFNSMIKVFQHRPNTAATVDFVECLPKSTKENALKLLKKYNAIKDNSLTALGKSIVKLPYPAKYSKLILLGIQWGLAYEAVVLVAFFSVKGRVFQYSADAELQRVTDSVKLQLVQGDSDTLSYLYIYKLWLEKLSSAEWCKINCINFDTLKCVQDKVNEICQVLGESLKENIDQEFSSMENCTTSLLEMLFECFQENLCVFTGHYKSGYRVLASHCIAFVHPSSIVCQMKNLPQFIIFDHMVTTSRDFLVSITSISNDLVMKGLRDQTIDFDYSDMFEKSLVQRVIEPVGERLIKQVLLGKKGKRLTEIEAQIKKSLSTKSLVIEPVLGKGHVLVYALETQVDEAVDLVNAILSSQLQEIMNSEETHFLDMKRGNIKIPVEIKWLKGVNVEYVKAGKQGQNLVTIQNNLEDEEASTEQLPCIIQQSVNLTWPRRRCNGKGFVTFHASDFMTARKLAMKSIAFRDTNVFVQLSRNAQNQLFITELPPDAKNSELEQAIKLKLPGIQITNVELKFFPPFETSQNERQDIKQKIEENCQNFTKLANFNVVVPLPKNTATVMQAYINANEDEDIVQAAIDISKCSIGEYKLTSKPVFRSIIKTSLEVCQYLKDRFQDTLKQLQTKMNKTYELEELFDFEINRLSDDMAAIKMLSNDKAILQTLQRTVNQLLEGEVLSAKFSNKLSKLFCHGGHLWLRTLEKTEKIHVIEDYVTKNIRLYGSKGNCNCAKLRITQFLEDTENELVKCIPLSIGENNRMLLKAVLAKYGANLEKFVEECELQSAVLDIKSCSLTLHGSRDCIEKAENILQKLAAEQCLNSESFSDALSKEYCPICFSTVDLTFRLELCGHLYCSQCIQILVDQAKFPVQCCVDDCSKDLILDDVHKILGDDPEKLNVLLEKSMKSYINDHKSEIFSCPAPDCTMFFYNKDVSVNKINCPLCQNDLCFKCNAVFHQGFTCEMYQGSKNDPDYSFKVWQQNTTECKRCPKCHTAIQRDGGCDHMNCSHCDSHFCWICLREFPDRDTIYRHLPFCDQHPAF